MNRLIIYLSLLFVVLPLNVRAQSGDIELSDSTSTDWGGGGGGGFNPSTPTGAVTDLTLSQTSASIGGSDIMRLVATINNNAQNKTVLWSTSNSNIASVDNQGNVYGISIGTATITATAAANSTIKATCHVMVTSNRIIGDSNGDGKVTIDDIVTIVNYIFGNPSAGFKIINANVNSDVDIYGSPKITIADVVALMNIILK